jgi:hypothetical protein
VEEYSWDIDSDDRMVIIIKHYGKQLFRISLCEAIESSSRKQVLAHIRECDKTPWLKRWQDEVMDDTVDKLKGVSR